MSDTSVPTNLKVKKWESDFYEQYVQIPDFASVMGTQENALIQVKTQLGKREGDTLYIQLVNRLTNAATTGSNVLEGNEEDMTQRSHAITINKRRNAVRIPEMEEIRSAIDLRDAARSVLMTWSKEDTRDFIIRQLGSLDGTDFLSRTAAIGDAWLVDNLDRVYFGANVGSGTDLSADLAQLDTTNDLFNSTALDGMILKAKTCNPKIRPLRDPGNGKRAYIAYANPHAFKDLKSSMASTLATTQVEAQGMKLFDGGDLWWNGVIVKEVDDLPIYANIGASGTAEVTPVYLCGAQALGVAWGRRWSTRTKEFDYGDKYGVAIDGIYAVSKLRFGTGTGDTDNYKDNGVVTGFFATTGSANASGLNNSGTSAEIG